MSSWQTRCDVPLYETRDAHGLAHPQPLLSPHTMQEVPPETQFLLTELQHGGPYAILLPLIDGPFRATLRPPSQSW